VVNSSNPDSLDTGLDNLANISLPVRVKTDLRIRGSVQVLILDEANRIEVPRVLKNRNMYGTP
jgi:hypothetical protein